MQYSSIAFSLSTTPLPLYFGVCHDPLSYCQSFSLAVIHKELSDDGLKNHSLVKQNDMMMVLSSFWRWLNKVWRSQGKSLMKYISSHILCHNFRKPFLLLFAGICVLHSAFLHSVSINNRVNTTGVVYLIQQQRKQNYDCWTVRSDAFIHLFYPSQRRPP